MKVWVKIILVLLLLCVVAMGIYIVIGGSPRNTSSSAQVTTLDVEGTIKDIGELATAEYAYKIFQVADKSLFTVPLLDLPVGVSKVAFSYGGVIKAGIQFNSIDITVNDNQKQIFIKLPKAEILSNELMNDSLVIYSEQYSPINSFTFRDMNTSQAELKTTAETEALESGLLLRATENAKTIITASIGGFYDLEEYDIAFY